MGLLPLAGCPSTVAMATLLAYQGLEAQWQKTTNFQPMAHAIRNPVELMGAIASMTTGGILERHPKLRCAFLEGTAGWVYWWLWRLDDQWEKYGPGCEIQLSMTPSEYFKRQCYIALDVD